MEFIKKDDITLEVTKPKEVVEEKTVYTLDYLKQQEINIQKQKDDFCNARDLELAEVRNLIAKCEELGVKSETVIAEAKISEETDKIVEEAIIK
jgi:hypothetical protein